MYYFAHDCRNLRADKTSFLSNEPLLLLTSADKQLLFFTNNIQMESSLLIHCDFFNPKDYNDLLEKEEMFANDKIEDDLSCYDTTDNGRQVR